MTCELSQDHSMAWKIRSEALGLSTVSFSGHIERLQRELFVVTT